MCVGLPFDRGAREPKAWGGKTWVAILRVSEGKSALLLKVGRARMGLAAFYLLERENGLCHTRFASLAIEPFSRTDSIFLISQEQRGFSLWSERVAEPVSHDR